MPPFYHLLIKSSRRRKDYIYIYCNMGQPKRRGNTLLPLQGVGFPGYTRLPRVPLRLPWAKRSWGFQPVVPDAPAYQILHVKLDTL